MDYLVESRLGPLVVAESKPSGLAVVLQGEDVIEAKRQVQLSAANVAAAAAQAAVAGQRAQETLTIKTQTEAVRDQAAVNAAMAAAFANPKVDIAAGLASTSGTGATNRWFSVFGTGSVFSTAYRNDAGSAVSLGQLPNLLAIAGSAPIVATISALKALDHSTITLGNLGLAGQVGVYRWDATYDKQRANADAAEHRVISPNKSVNGAWVRSSLSSKERDGINAAYRRVFERWPASFDNFDPSLPIAPLFGRRVNFNSASENLSDGHYSVDAPLVLQSETMDYKGVTLRRLSTTSSGFFARVRDLRAADYDLEDGKLYIASIYVCAPMARPDSAGLDAPNNFMWMFQPPNATAYASGAKLMLPTPRRVHSLIMGGSVANTLKVLLDPTLPWSDAAQTQSNAQLQWFSDCFGLGGTISTPEVWLGGLQIEEATDQTEKSGIATLGTSIDTSGGGAGNGKDHWTQGRGWSRWLEGLLCAPIFPASIGGQVASAIDARFNTDVAPLRAHAKYLMLCANVNDFTTGFSSASYRASWVSIYSKALAAGWLPDEIIWMTIQPRSVYDYAAGAADLAAENAYIKATYRNVIDRGEAMRDAIDTGLLPVDYETDGIHQNGAASRALAFMIYNKYRHFFRFRNVPGPYQKTVNDDSKVQSFGTPHWLGRFRAQRISSASAATIRESDLGTAPVLVFEAALGGAVTYQLPCPNYQRPTERVNTDVAVQMIMNSTGQQISVQYYARDASNVLSTVGGVIGPIPNGSCWTVACDGTTAWRVQ